MRKKKSLLNESLSDWLSFGFDMEVQGDVCLVNAIPSEISQENMIEILQHFFEEESVDDLGELKEHLCRIMAKSAAVKKGTTLNEAEINHLVQELFKLEQFNYSPFGKKYIIHFLYKRFKKIRLNVSKNSTDYQEFNHHQFAVLFGNLCVF